MPTQQKGPTIANAGAAQPTTVDALGMPGAAGNGLSRRAWAMAALRLGGAASLCAAGGYAAGVWAQAPALGTASAALPSAATSKLEKRRLTIAVPSKAALVYLPLTVAEQLGFFQAEGLELEVVEAPSMQRAQQMATGGGADVVSGWLENTLMQQARGQAFMAFVLQGRAPQIALGVSTKTLPDVRQLADLRGKKIGVIATGTPTHTVAYAVLARAGVRMGDISFVGLSTPQAAAAALRSGQIDALSYTDPLITQLEQRGELRVLADTRSLRGTLQVCGGEMPATCLYAPPEFVQKHPNTTQAATHAMVHALKWLQTAGLSDLMKIVPESYFAGDRALYLSAFARMREAIALDGLIPPVGVRNTLSAMLSADPVLRNDNIDPSKCFTNAFAQRAKERYKV
jgi:NitT/TauT family transport system substrate-binding protein